MANKKGMQELNFNFPPGRREPTETERLLSETFFHETLPKHQHSLPGLRYTCGPGLQRASCDTWVGQIVLCRSLEDLGIVYDFPPLDEDETPGARSMGAILSILGDRLPRFQRLGLSPVRKANLRFRSRFDTTMGRSAAACLSAVTILAATRPQYTVGVGGSRFKPLPDSTLGQYKLHNAPRDRTRWHANMEYYIESRRREAANRAGTMSSSSAPGDGVFP